MNPQVWRLYARKAVLIALLQVTFYSSVSQADVEIKNHLGAKILSHEYLFTSDEGTQIRLEQYFHKGRPVLLAMAYYGCAGPCTLLLNNLTTTLKNTVGSAGHAFEVVVVSIDPNESATLAKAKKQTYLKKYARPEGEKGWHFLTGSEPEIKTLSDTLGFSFEKNQTSGTFNHPSALFVLSPEGVLTSTLTGTQFKRKDLNVALYEASHGKIQVYFSRMKSYCGNLLPRVEFFRSAKKGAFFLLAALSLLFSGFYLKSRPLRSR